MENINENPIVEETVYEAPVFETPVVEEPVAEPIVETPVVEEAAEAVVEAPAYQAPEEVQALGAVAAGVIGATTAPKAPEKIKTPKTRNEEETVAVKSTKNVSWPGVGKVYVGINIVTKSAADKWVTRSHISLPTPEEVAKEFGK
jgi:hypothetical protein